MQSLTLLCDSLFTNVGSIGIGTNVDVYGSPTRISSEFTASLYGNLIVCYCFAPSGMNHLPQLVLFCH